jgi:hypothetical protein
MTTPTSSQEIYDLLAADPVISAELGTYLSPGGSSLPAISVLAANENLPPGTVAGGIEITITRMPGLAPQLTLGGDTMLNPTWRIYVIAWDALGELQTVAQRVIALLPGATAMGLQADPPGEGLGVLEQVVISWTNPAVVLEGIE